MLGRVMDAAFILWGLLASRRAFHRGYDAGYTAHHEMAMEEIERCIAARAEAIRHQRRQS